MDMSKHDGGYLTCERLLDGINGFSDPYPFRTGKDDIWLMGDSIQCAETEHKGRIDRHVMVDAELHEVIVEAYCPNWRISDIDGALRFANKWNYEHHGGQLLVDMWRSRFLWRWVVDTRWVMDKEDMDEFIEDQFIDMETESSECFEAAYREMHGMRPKEDEPFGDAGEWEDNSSAGEPADTPPEQGEFVEEPMT